MRLAVFTSQFPAKVSTFFARDMRSLLATGLEIDIFSIYPEQQDLWQYVPDLLKDSALSRNQIHHANRIQVLSGAFQTIFRNPGKFVSDTALLTNASMTFGVRPVVKTFYSMLAAYSWAGKHGYKYDHLLAYWANYSATCAYVFHRLIDRAIPFSFVMHAGTDLYREQIFLREKMIYADNIIVVCEFNKNFIKQKYPDVFGAVEHKIHTHHPGLDLSEFPFDSTKNVSNTIVAVGNLIQVKGFDYLLRSLEQLKRRNVALQLELVGGGEQFSVLYSLAERLGILQQIQFHGWLTPEQTRDVIRRGTILVHPSSGLGDAVPTVIKEAMALGTPVVASSVAGIPELLDYGECGILVPPADDTALANAIESFINSPGKRKEFSEKARRFAENHFDMWSNGARLAKLLLNTKRSGELSSKLELIN